MLVLLTLFPLLFAVPAVPPLEAPTVEAMGRLEAGEVLVEDSRTDQAGGSARVQLLMRAPVAAIWRVITSCDLAFFYLEGLETCEVLEDSGEYAVIHQQVKKSWLIPRQDFTFEVERVPYRYMRFNLVDGNLRAMEVSWQFREMEQGTLVVHEARIQPSISVPRFMLRRTLRDDMPDTVACIRGLAGGSGSAALRARDLARCAGPRRPPAPGEEAQ